MKRLFLFTVIAGFLFTGIGIAAEIGGVVFDEVSKENGVELKLNGCGLRTKFGFKVYAVGLYLKDKTADDKAIVEADQPMALVKNFRRTVPVRKMKNVFYDSFAAIVNAPKQDEYDETSDYGPMTKDIVGFMNAIAAEKLTKKHRFTYLYTPGKGTAVYLDKGDGKVLKTTIPGLEFKKALFKIWLGDNPPVGDKLKNKLLGK